MKQNYYVCMQRLGGDLGIGDHLTVESLDICCQDITALWGLRALWQENCIYPYWGLGLMVKVIPHHLL